MPQVSLVTPDDYFTQGTRLVLELFVIQKLNLKRIAMIVRKPKQLNPAQLEGAEYAVEYLLKENPTGEW